MSRVAGGAQEGGRQGVLSRFLHPEAGAESGQDPREAVLETLASTLLRRSRPDAPLLIVWEDLHWADPSSIAFIITLLQQIQAAPTLRSEERRVGTECVSTCRSRWWPYHYKKKERIKQQ